MSEQTVTLVDQTGFGEDRGFAPTSEPLRAVTGTDPVEEEPEPQPTPAAAAETAEDVPGAPIPDAAETTDTPGEEAVVQAIPSALEDIAAAHGLKGWRKADLIALADLRGVDNGGTVAELTERLKG